MPKTAPAILADGDPATAPTYDLEADGTARVDLCLKCVEEGGLLMTTTQNADALH
jgi:hypothetical protein